MKLISQKHLQSAMEHTAELLKKDGSTQSMTVQELLDVAQFHPAQFASSLPALEILGLLGLGSEVVRVAEIA